MYRNIEYNYKTSNVKLFTWDKDGKRVVRNFHYKPHFYTETGNNTGIKSIFGGNLKKHEFDNDFDRRQSIKSGNIERVYGNLPIEQQFLVDAYWQHNKKEGFSQFPLSIFYIDIEVYSPDEFPEQWEANHPVNVVTIYNSLKNEFRVFCLGKDFTPENLSDENTERYKKIGDVSKFKVTTHATEKQLLEAFISYWVRDYPDVITGWNLPFDIPYLINRIIRKLSKKDAKRLSPVGNFRDITRKQKMGAQYDQDVRDYSIDGITYLDYHDVYMKFNNKPIPNRQLDTVLNIELGKGKVKYESANLAKLSEDDWDLFVFYNIEDVNGLKLLEEKLHYLEISRMLAYMGLVPLKKSLDTLVIVNGYCAVNALEDGKIIPTFKRDNIEWRKYDGAFVKEPESGLYSDVVSFDLNSLYPMTIITLNMSPETKFGKVKFLKGDKVLIEDNVGKETTLSTENFYKLIKKYKLALSKANILFTQNKQGIVPRICEEVYNKRLEDKAQIKKNNQKLEDGVDKKTKKEIELQNVALDVAQYAKKIFINSVYGALGNKYMGMSDLDIAESVTLTCQDVIKESSEILNNIVYDICGTKDIPEPTRYNDTDSVYLSIVDVVKKYNLKFFDEEGKVNPKIVSLSDKIEEKLNDGIKSWGERELNSQDCRFEFKMEAIADRALFIAKKNYALHVINSEGFHVEKESKRWKYKGIRLVSAGMPEAVKPIVEKILQELILTGKKKNVDALYSKAFDEFKNLNVSDIALIKSLNKFDEYVDKCDGWNVAPRMQANYRGAYYYNRLIKLLDIDNKYMKIRQGDKVKFLYLNPNNKYGINVIGYVDQYPTEFEKLLSVDMQMMFEKCVKDIVEQFYDAMGWHIFAPNKQPVVDIMEEFFN
jgi:DNA polymerase elongation subunit (family B)